MADSTLVSRLLDLRSDPWPPDTRLSSESHARDALVSTVESLEHRLPQTDWYHDPALEERHTINLTEVISVMIVFPQLQPQQLSVLRKPITDLICQQFHHFVFGDLLSDLLPSDWCWDCGRHRARCVTPTPPRPRLPPGDQQC